MDKKPYDNKSYITRYVAGRQDTGGSFSVTVNLTHDTEGTIAQWEKAIQEYNTAQASGKELWFEICHPVMPKAWFIIVQMPQKIPVPEFSQNELLTVEIPLTIEEYKGMSEKVTPASVNV